MKKVRFALALTGASAVTVFTDANELPRWLQGKPYYNVGRRNNLWMLQHAMTAAQELGDHVAALAHCHALLTRVVARRRRGADPSRRRR